MLQLLIDFLIQLPKTKNTLTLPSKKGEVHPLHPKLRLLAVLSSGRQPAIENFHKKLRKLSQTPGEHPQDQVCTETMKILIYYNKIGHNEESEFKYLVKKMVMLFMILGPRRKHAHSAIYVDNITFNDDKVILLPNKTLKHSKPTRPLQPLI